VRGKDPTFGPLFGPGSNTKTCVPGIGGSELARPGSAAIAEPGGVAGLNGPRLAGPVYDARSPTKPTPSVPARAVPAAPKSIERSVAGCCPVQAKEWTKLRLSLNRMKLRVSVSSHGWRIRQPRTCLAMGRVPPPIWFTLPQTVS